MKETIILYNNKTFLTNRDEKYEKIEWWKIINQ
jgi:hypothetical protein